MLRFNINLLSKLLKNDNLNSTASKLNSSYLRRCSTLNVNQKESTNFLNSDKETFGTLTKPALLEKHEEKFDEGDLQEENLLENINPNARKLSTKQYADIIKKFIKKRQIQEAIDVVEKRMLQEDRAKPENYIYNLLLGACGRLGYTKKAFGLFNDMKKRGLQPTGGTYTALFNACSNSPWPEDGLVRAKKLRELMFEKGFIANDTTYNSMIKAFGRCSDIQTAFTIVDEMKQNQIPIKTETINFLMQSCITNKESGYLQALLIWRKFHENKKLNPDIYSFNLLLHCIRDCGIGDPEVAEKLLLGSDNENLRLESKEHKLIEAGQNLEAEERVKIGENMELVNKNEKNLDNLNHVPDVLASHPYLGNMVNLFEIKTPEQKLLLVGGFSGFLQTMEKNNVSPDIKTFCMLLDNIPSTLAAENTLLKAIKKTKIKIDIDFLNMLIRKRCFRKDYESAREVMQLFDKYHLLPNIMTYGVLALTCTTLEDAQMLLKEMEENGYRVNIEILGALLRNACVQENFFYIFEIMDIVQRENIKPNKQFLGHLERLHAYIRKHKKEGIERGAFWQKGSKLFLQKYKEWFKGVEKDEIEEVHPWEQFRNPVATNIKNYKDPQVHFKPRVTSKFCVKTGTLQKSLQNKK